jgi:hypothetical protein
VIDVEFYEALPAISAMLQIHVRRDRLFLRNLYAQAIRLLAAF